MATDALWIFPAGIGLFCVSSILADGGKTPKLRSQRPIQWLRLFKNVLALLFALFAVGFPVMLEKPLPDPATTWQSHMNVFLYTTTSIMWFFHVVDFMNDFQGNNLCELGLFRRALHVFSIIDTRDLVYSSSREGLRMEPFHKRRPLRDLFIIPFFFFAMIAVTSQLSKAAPFLPKLAIIWLHVILAVGIIYAAIDLVYFMWEYVLLLIGLVLPSDLHRNPIFSCSLTEFWGHRWNGAISRSLRNHFFNPVLKRNTTELAPKKSYNKTPSKKPKVWQIGVGFALTFLASGFLHAWPIYVTLRDVWPALYALLYFSLQAVLCAFERLVLKLHLWPNAARHVWTVSMIVLPIPLFVVPLLDVWKELHMAEAIFYIVF